LPLTPLPLPTVSDDQNVQGNKEDVEDLIGALDRIRLSVTEPLREDALQNHGNVTQSLSDRVDSLTRSEFTIRLRILQVMTDDSPQEHRQNNVKGEQATLPGAHPEVLP
jgi:hypothetical protein